MDAESGAYKMRTVRPPILDMVGPPFEYEVTIKQTWAGFRVCLRVPWVVPWSLWKNYHHGWSEESLDIRGLFDLNEGLVRLRRYLDPNPNTAARIRIPPPVGMKAWPK